MTIIRYNTLAPSVMAFSTERECNNPAAPYDGFNITHYCGDAPEHVSTCRRQLCQQLGIGTTHLIVPRQVHGTDICEVTPDTLSDDFTCDALITRLTGVCIGISTADCVPLLFHDGRNHAIAAAHAGWRGTAGRIGALTVEALQRTYGSRPQDLSCIVGPSIGPAAFEVGDEVYDAFSAAGFPMPHIAFRERQRWHIDLWRANVWQLTAAGIPAGSIHVSALCTYNLPHRFFSARRLGIHSGRLFSGILFPILSPSVR